MGGGRCCCCWAIAVGLGKTLTPVASSNLLDRSLLERRPNELCLDFPLTSVLGMLVFHTILYRTGCKLLKLLRVDFRLSLVVWLFKANNICNGSLILPTMMMTNPQWHVKAENVGSIPRFLSPLTTSVLTLMRKTKCCVKKYFWFEFKWSNKERILLAIADEGAECLREAGLVHKFASDHTQRFGSYVIVGYGGVILVLGRTGSLGMNNLRISSNYALKLSRLPEQFTRLQKPTGYSDNSAGSPLP